MNTINAIKPYINSRNNIQKPQEPISYPTFKGALGQKVVNEIRTKKTVTVAGILAMVAGGIGLSKEKVSDVLESLLEEIEKLRSSNESLSKYKNMLEVKSIDENGVLTPSNVLELLNEIKEYEFEAYKSLLNFVMTGKGGEDFIDQMNRYAVLSKADKDGTTKTSTVKKALEKTKEEMSYTPYYSDQFAEALQMLENVLSIHPEGENLVSDNIYTQVYENAKALLYTLKQANKHYPRELYTVINRAKCFHEHINAKEKEILNQGFEYVETKSNGPSRYKTYKTYRNIENGCLYDISLASLNSGFLSEARVRTPEGEIIKNHWNIKE